MQQIMEQEIKKQMEMLYPNSPEHLYNKMQVEFYSCNYEKKKPYLSLSYTKMGIKSHVHDTWRYYCSRY